MNSWESSIQHGTYREVCLGSMRNQDMYSGSKDVEVFPRQGLSRLCILLRGSHNSPWYRKRTQMQQSWYYTVPRSKHIKAIPQKMQRFATIKTGRCFLMFFIFLFFFSQLNQKEPEDCWKSWTYLRPDLWRRSCAWDFAQTDGDWLPQKHRCLWMCAIKYHSNYLPTSLLANDSQWLIKYGKLENMNKW